MDDHWRALAHGTHRIVSGVIVVYDDEPCDGAGLVTGTY